MAVTWPVTGLRSTCNSSENEARLQPLLQEFQADGEGHLAGAGRERGARMTCAVPRVCAVLLLPPPPNFPHASVCHGYSYVALELSNVPSIEVVTLGHL